MELTFCYLEIYNNETNQWECIYDANKPPNLLHDCTTYEVEPFFERTHLFYVLNKIECNSPLTLFPMCKGLPKDSSHPIVCEYYFWFNKMEICHSASYIDLKELIDFDYSKIFNLKEIHINVLKDYYPELVEKEKFLISYKEWLGQDYFTELQKLKHLYENEKSRLIYFVFNHDDEMYGDCAENSDSI